MLTKLVDILMALVVLPCSIFIQLCWFFSLTVDEISRSLNKKKKPNKLEK